MEYDNGAERPGARGPSPCADGSGSLPPRSSFPMLRERPAVIRTGSPACDAGNGGREIGNAGAVLGRRRPEGTGNRPSRLPAGGPLGLECVRRGGAGGDGERCIGKSAGSECEERAWPREQPYWTLSNVATRLHAGQLCCAP